MIILKKLVEESNRTTSYMKEKEKRKISETQDGHIYIRYFYQ